MTRSRKNTQPLTHSTNVLLSEETYEKLRRESYKKKFTMAEIMRMALDLYFAAQEQASEII